MVLAHARHIVVSLWLIIGAVWLVTAFFAKRSTRTQSLGSNLYHRALSILAILVGFTPFFDCGGLTRRFIPPTAFSDDGGLVLALAGVAFAIWARFSLGGNWSATVTIKAGHTLVRRGPYAWVRHPIYSGLLAALLGTALVYNQVRCLVAVALVMVMLASKIGMEEKFMTEQFGPQYQEYKRQVKALIPFVW